MADYDAFGRKIGEDPLEALRDSTAPSAPPSPSASPPPPAALRQPRPEPIARRRRARIARPRIGGRLSSGLAGWLVLPAFLGAALAGVYGTSVESGSDGVTIGPAIDPAQPAAGLNRTSLIRERNFAEAVDALSRAGRGRPLTLRLAAGRIDAALLDKGRVHHVQITPGGELTELATTAAPPNRTAIPYARIDVGAPQRLVRAGATRRTPARRIDYLVLTPGPPTAWGAYFKGGRIVIGDAHGRKQRTI